MIDRNKIISSANVIFQIINHIGKTSIGCGYSTHIEHVNFRQACKKLIKISKF